MKSRCFHQNLILIVIKEAENVIHLSSLNNLQAHFERTTKLF
jgi:hypothetical protein